MRLKKKSVFMLLSIFVAVIVMTSVGVYVAQGQEGYRTIIVTEVSGDVSVVKDNIEYEAYTGMHLREGYVVVTSANSYVRMVLDEDKYVKIEAGSRAIFETLGRVGSGKTVIKMERGAITTEVVTPLTDDEEFIVNTPNALLAVRGTYFRVDLSTTENGEKNTDVYTYGGCVASRRIMPSGEIVEEDVKVDAGYKVKVNMDEVDTVYVVDEAVVTPVKIYDIPDEDLVDMYFASENGHRMFMDTETIKKDIEERDIDIDEYTPVYDVAKDVIESDKEGVDNKVNPENAPDDKNQPDTDDDLEDYYTGAPSDGKHVHNKQITVVEATCTEAGYIQTDCTRCQLVISKKEIPAKGHIESVPVVKVQATCTETGLNTVACEVCQEVLSESVIAAKGHKEKVETANGKITVSCENCGKVIKETVIPDTEHKEKVTTIPATCTTPGKVTVTCSECGKLITEMVIPATGHSEETKTVYATCTTAGKTTVTCVTCGKVISEKTIPATGHTEKVNKVDATLASAGTYRRYCSVCNTTLESYSIPKLTALRTDDGNITITSTGYKQGNMTTEVPYTGTYTITQSSSSKGVNCSIAVKSGKHNIVLDGVNISSGGLNIAKGATVTLDGTKANTISCANGVVNNGTLDIIGGSLELASNTIVNGVDYIKCTILKELPGTLTFVKTDGSTFTYSLSSADRASDGRYYVWRLDYGMVVSASNFPDANLRKYVLTNYDTNGNGRLSDTEIEAAVEMNLTGSVSSLSGIEYLTSLASLNVSGITTLTTLDVSNCIALTEVSANGCSSLKTFITKGCITLRYIDISNCTGITSIDVSTNTQLRYLYCCGNTGLSQLDVTNNNQLILLDACGAKFSTLNLSKCVKLKSVILSKCANLKSLDVSMLSALETYDVSYSAMESITLDNNTSVKSVIATNCTALTTLSAKGCTALTKLDVTGCDKLTNLDVTGCTALTAE